MLEEAKSKVRYPLEAEDGVICDGLWFLFELIP